MKNRFFILFICFGIIACSLPSPFIQPKKEEGPALTKTESETAVPKEKNAPEKLSFIHKNIDFGSYLAGRFAQRSHDFSVSADYFQKTLQKDPANTELKIDYYLIQVLQGNLSAVQSILPEIIKLEKPALFAEYVAVLNHYQKKEFDTALSVLKSKQPHAVDKLLIPLSSAWICAAKGDEKSAFASLTPLEKDNRTESLFLYHTALLHIFFKQPDKADRLFQQFRTKEFPSLSALSVLKEFYQQQGNWNAQNPLYEKYQLALLQRPLLQVATENPEISFTVTSADKGLSEAFYNLSFLIGQLNLPESSLLLNSLALELNKQNLTALIWGAEIFEHLKCYELANKLYDAIPAMNDTILLKKALNLLLLEKNEEAEKILTDLIVRNPFNPLLYSLKADLMRDTNRANQAIEYYTTAIMLLQNKKEEVKALEKAYFSRGVAWDLLNEAEKTENDFLQALQLNPKNPLILNYLGYSWMEKGKNLSTAYDFIEQAYQLAPEDPNVIDSMAWKYYKTKQFGSALLLSESAVSKKPGSAVINSHLGDIYNALGRKREAGFQYKKALDLKADSSDFLRQELRRKLEVL